MNAFVLSMRMTLLRVAGVCLARREWYLHFKPSNVRNQCLQPIHNVVGGTPLPGQDAYAVPDLDDQVSYVIETQGENGPQTLSTDYCTCLQEWWEKLMQHS